MFEPDQILRILEDRMRELGLTQQELGAKAFGRSDNTAIQSLKKGSSPAIDRVAAMAKALDLELYFGPKRADGTPEPVQSPDLSHYASIPLHSASLAAGAGAENGEVDIVDHLVFRREWLSKMGINPNTAAIARVTGDSMAPGIQTKDLVLIDTSKRIVPSVRRTKGGGIVPIFVFIQNGEARVKRIERPAANMLVLISDNQAYPPEVIVDPPSGTFSILGQVVWTCHAFR